MDIARTGYVSPLGDVVAIRVEYLDATVLAIAHEDPTVVVNANVVWQRKLARTLTRYAPCKFELAVSTESVDPAITVTVRHEYPTVRSDRNTSGRVERLAMHAVVGNRHRCPIAISQFQQQLARTIMLGDSVSLLLCKPDVVIRVDEHAVRLLEERIRHAPSPTAGQVPIGSPPRHGKLTAAVDPDVVA